MLSIPTSKVLKIGVYLVVVGSSESRDVFRFLEMSLLKESVISFNNVYFSYIYKQVFIIIITITIAIKI